MPEILSKLAGDVVSCFVGEMTSNEAAQKWIIRAQVVGAPMLVLMQGPFMITYLSRLGLSSSRVLEMLALLSLVRTLIQPPLAYAGDRFGKKPLGYVGFGAIQCSMLGLCLLPGFPEHLRMGMLTFNILLFGMGGGVAGSIWFGLLTPLIDTEKRGRFLSKLRISWQFSSLILVACISWLLDQYTSIRMYQAVFGLGFVLSFLRILFYSRIPEVEPPTRSTLSLRKALYEQLQDARLRSFCSYAFLLMVVVAPLPFVSALLMKDVLKFNEGRIVHIGNLSSLGAILGFFLGGRMVDHYGTKSVFISAHLSFALLFAAIPLYAIPGWPAFLHFAIISFLSGLVGSSNGIAMSSTAMGLADKSGQRSLATSLTNTCIQLGPPVSLFLISRVLEMELLAETWTLYGITLGPYDAIMLMSSVVVLLLVITLGLVPYALHTARTIPRVGSNGPSV